MNNTNHSPKATNPLIKQYEGLKNVLHLNDAAVANLFKWSPISLESALANELSIPLLDAVSELSMLDETLHCLVRCHINVKGNPIRHGRALFPLFATQEEYLNSDMVMADLDRVELYRAFVSRLVYVDTLNQFLGKNNRYSVEHVTQGMFNAPSPAWLMFCKERVFLNDKQFCKLYQLTMEELNGWFNGSIIIPNAVVNDLQARFENAEQLALTCKTPNDLNARYSTVRFLKKLSIHMEFYNEPCNCFRCNPN